MEDTLKTLAEKISSYNLFNNLFPGALFCFILSKITRFDLSSENILEQLFVWYFIGMIISRIGSIFVEETLKKIKIKGKKYITFASYDHYIVASEAKPFIATLSETNNTYRTIISLLVSVGIVYLYDLILYDWIVSKCAIGNKLILGIMGIFLLFLFIKSYKKQTHYIKKQVDKHMNQ